jgi:hypothetical protein
MLVDNFTDVSGKVAASILRVVKEIIESVQVQT